MKLRLLVLGIISLNSFLLDAQTFRNTKSFKQQMYVAHEEEPQFPGGRDSLLSLINQNFPPSEGIYKSRIIVRFTIDKEGKVLIPEILRSDAPSMEIKVLEFIENMPNWLPGKQRGKPVEIKYTLPIYVEAEFPIYNKTKELIEVFTVVEKQPEFLGGKNALKQYLEHEINRLKVEEEGKVMVQFVIDTLGSITNIRILKSENSKLNNMAVEILQNMPKWNPGRQRVKPVNTYYILPVIFGE